MYKLLPLAGDIGTGILVIILTSLAFGFYEPYVWLLLPLILLPDLDAIPEIIKKGRVAASPEHPYDHRELLHKPVLWLLGGALLWAWFGYYGAIAFWLVLFHFLHDSVLTGWGVQWFWPLSKTQYKFFVDERNEVSLKQGDWLRSWKEEHLQAAIMQHGFEDWIERYYLKPTIQSVVEYSTFVFSILMLILFLAR